MKAGDFVTSRTSATPIHIPVSILIPILISPCPFAEINSFSPIMGSSPLPVSLQSKFQKARPLPRWKDYQGNFNMYVFLPLAEQEFDLPAVFCDGR